MSKPKRARHGQLPPRILGGVGQGQSSRTVDGATDQLTKIIGLAMGLLTNLLSCQNWDEFVRMRDEIKARMGDELDQWQKPENRR